MKTPDDLPLGGFPARYQGKWWGIRASLSALVPSYPDSLLQGRASVSRPSKEFIVIVSDDGAVWDSVAVLASGRVASDVRVSTGVDGLWFSAVSRQSPSLSVVANDVSVWWTDGLGWTGLDPAASYAYEQYPSEYLGIGTGGHKRGWDSGWWHLRCSIPDRCELNGKTIPGVLGWNDLRDDPRVVRWSKDGIFLFGGSANLSADDSVSVVHAITYPGGGRHFERMLGGDVISVSDSGVYLGRILSGIEGGDPRGTWVKKTEIPVLY